MTWDAAQEIPFGCRIFDGAVSVESLHHFTKEEKIPLYAKIRDALEAGGYFVLTDYFALSKEEALEAAGFSAVEILNHWGATYTLKATR